MEKTAVFPSGSISLNPRMFFFGVLPVVRGITIDSYTKDDGLRYRPRIENLTDEHRERIRQNNTRWAFISGDKDYNYEQVALTAKQFKANDFQTRFVDVPGMGHSPADPGPFREALEWILK
ncbi:MAG: hypothetical protein LAT58_00235 [Opitutales bacterium]|nr:hypothetical protein [Opitutales bacterium]